MTAPASPHGPRAARIAKLPRVLGAAVDDQTRCAHYRGETDIVAMRFKCCGHYYPCFACHEEAAGHPAERWDASDIDRPAVLCGACRTELRIADYLGTSECPACAARFNPGCRLHHHLYFAFDPAYDDGHTPTEKR